MDEGEKEEERGRGDYFGWFRRTPGASLAIPGLLLAGPSDVVPPTKDQKVALL